MALSNVEKQMRYKARHPERYQKKHLANQVRYQEKHPERIREYLDGTKDARRSTILKNKYGITLRQFNEMLAKQDFRCAICGGEDSKTKSGVLVVDHDHETDEVRGLLCFTCNTGLGHFRDSVELLDRAGDYLGG